MIGRRNLPTAVAGLLLTPLAAQAQKRRRWGAMCSGAEWRRRGRLHALDNVRFYCTAEGAFSRQVDHSYSGASCHNSQLTEQEVGESEYPRARHGSAC
jgi:hypothetical protein